MLKDLAETLKAIGEFLASIVTFVVDFIGDLVYTVELIGETVLGLPDYFTWLPSSIVALIISLFAIVVIYKVLGRQ